MKLSIKYFSSFLLLLINALGVFGQCLPLPILTVQNPSFEGPPQAHVTPAPWTNCQPSQTPDTQPGNWGIAMPPTNGSTYLGLVHQPSANWQEGASQLLSSPMTAGIQYSFTIDVANSSSTGGGIDPGCAEFQIWGSNSSCAYTELLWSSGNITPYDVWQTYNVVFTPTQSWPYLTLYINGLGCSTQPYILVDNMSPITPQNVSISSMAINQNVTCPGLSNGQATAIATGQYRPFNYVWNTNPAQTDSVLTNVSAGTYTVTVTDANTCTATASVTITEPSPIVLTPTINHITCFGFTDGSAYMSYAGGTVPFSFLWSNNVTSQNISNLDAGTYVVTATDGNSCTAFSSIVINEPAQLTLTGNEVNPTCISPGLITVNVTGGSLGYSYLWNTTPPQTTQSASNLSGGYYTVTVTDVENCTASADFSLPPPPTPPAITITTSDVICYGESNGSASLLLTGGTPPYTYQWNTVPVQTTSTAAFLNAGTYSVTVTDANSCSSSSSVTIDEPLAIVTNLSTTDVLCFGDNTGAASISASGGVGGFAYNWSTVPVQTTQTAVNLVAGNYSVTITDMNNCSSSVSANLSQPSAPLALSETHVDVLCFGESTGSATAVVSGGTTGYTYVWNTTPLQTTSSAAGLTAGSYYVTVEDANGCTASVSAVVNQPLTEVNVTATVTAPLCFGQSSASASASASGGAGGYSYLWNTVPSVSSPNIYNIPAGTYSVLVTDMNNCSATDSIIVAPPPTQLVLTLSHTDVACFGDSTGSISVSASGSYGSYSYVWSTSPVQSTPIASHLPAATYSVTVTDIQGCTATGADVISQPASALSLTTSSSDVICFGEANGSAMIVASGGTPSYSYLWDTSPVQTSDVVTLLTSGTYTVTVVDANLCRQIANVSIHQPTAALSVTYSISDVLCYGQNNGSVSLTVAGGTPLYDYSWSHDSSLNSPSSNSMVVGSYSVSVTDANSCSVVLSNLIISEPAVLSASSSAIDESCDNNGDGNITVSAVGGTTPYNYYWNIGSSNLPVLSDLSRGSYRVTITDAHGCTVSLTANVSTLPGVSMTAQVGSVLCYPLTNGFIDVTANSFFTPLSFQWSNGATSEDLNSLDVGNYYLTITDAHNCTALGTFTIENDSIFSIEATPEFSTIDLGQNVYLDVVPYGSTFGTLEWKPSLGLSCNDCASPISSPIDDIVYTVTATDVNGCIATDVVHVNVVPKYVVFIPNAFTPNGDGNNDYFEVWGNKEAWKQFEVNIFNRIGEKVFESNDMNFQWDGTYKGELMNPSVLVYLVKVIYMDNYSEKLFKGTITLIR